MEHFKENHQPSNVEATNADSVEPFLQSGVESATENTQIEGADSNSDPALLPAPNGEQSGTEEQSAPIDEIASINKIASRNTAKPIPPRPIPLPVLLNNIPSFLQSFKNWVTWKYIWTEAKNGKTAKWDKPPLQLSGRHARTNDSSTWETYQAVAQAYGTGQVDGIGIVVTQEMGTVAVDLDGVRDPATGALIPDAQRVVEALNTYTEISPSGTGLRLFARGTLPTGRRSRMQPHGDKYEVYNSLKYLSITGQVLPGASAIIEERTEQLHQFHSQYIEGILGKVGTVKAALASSSTIPAFEISDKEVLQRAQESKNGDKFIALWNGDTSLYQEDHSAAVLALCNHLAYWTGNNAVQIDRLFRQSKLMYPKWDTVHTGDGQTFGQYTIAGAIRSCKQPFVPLFPSLQAEDIPQSPASNGNKRSPYDARTIVKLLYPQWEVSSLGTHAANALRLREHLKNRIHFSPQLGWLHYINNLWEVDEPSATRTCAMAAKLSSRVRAEVVQLYHLASVLARAGRFEDADSMSQIAAAHSHHAKVVEDSRFIKDTLQQAAGLDGIRVDQTRFNPKPWVLGFLNGVWDRGEWRDHRYDDYLLAVCPVEIDVEILNDPQAALAGEWGQVLDRICGEDQELKQTLQDLAGYILSGASHLRLIPWAYGEKGTGKSTYTVLLQTMLGENAKAISPSDLGRNSDRDRVGYKLLNRRLLVCAEAGFKIIEAELLKTLSGGDVLGVRKLYRESFDTNPFHVLVMVSNDPPRLDAHDEALKDRLIALPFTNALKSGGQLTLTGGGSVEEVRKHPENPLVREFAVWALQGMARVLQTEKVYLAPSVMQATRAFWIQTDPTTEFWRTIPADKLLEGIFKKELRDLYEQWCENHKIRPFTNIAWNRACKGVGLIECRRSARNIKAWMLAPENPTTQDLRRLELQIQNTAQTLADYNLYAEEIENKKEELLQVDMSEILDALD